MNRMHDIMQTRSSCKKQFNFLPLHFFPLPWQTNLFSLSFFERKTFKSSDIGRRPKFCGCRSFTFSLGWRERRRDEILGQECRLWCAYQKDAELTRGYVHVALSRCSTQLSITAVSWASRKKRGNKTWWASGNKRPNLLPLRTLVEVRGRIRRIWVMHGVLNHWLIGEISISKWKIRSEETHVDETGKNQGLSIR